MSDLLIRSDPVQGAPFVASGVTISLAQPMARYSLRARQVWALETVLDLKLPKKIGDTLGDAACLGPDEWLLRTGQGTRIPFGEGLPVAVTDVSDRALCLIVQGPRAAEILMSGCPLDLDAFGVGRATRTIFETTEIIIIRTAADCFHIEVWCSFAPWLWAALTNAARH
jgi:sarcosine oxidase, subunit gamma